MTDHPYAAHNDRVAAKARDARAAQLEERVAALEAELAGLTEDDAYDVGADLRRALRHAEGELAVVRDTSLAAILDGTATSVRL